MANIFKIAIVQENRDPYDSKWNTEKGLSIVKKAKVRGADIVLFPECWITGYEFPSVDESLTIEEIMKTSQFREWNYLAIDENSQYIKAFCGIAKQLNIGIVITGYTKGINRPQNSAFVISKNGEILMKYSKVHTCDFADERMLECGDQFKVCDFEGIKIGIMICYDREYPESARILMLKGAEVILLPNDCGAMPPRVQVLSTRAYENMVGVVMANPPGKNAGCSCAFSPITWDKNGVPIDNTITMADDETEDIFMAEYDIEKLRDYRSHEMMGNTFRKVKAYSELLNDEIKEPFKR
ncbi:carbon-nitrogen hydrolase family protein [Clostridium tagluense]|uniref:carbon-nitrogen hydrolase family protein n=1 Tax=Clostridium tagluense TaxID=360422 RepID=UPI001CF361FD|nr:carbon-nitrogen hydrolase family protein [Clostridium tagluense]MCB2299325.1 carbon-nitrogen hydrolase family protein [Clostridium tagluense]